MTNREDSAVTTTPPVVFLNPAVILERPHILHAQGQPPVVGMRTTAPMPTRAVEVLTELCRALTAPLVLTSIWAPNNMREELQHLGLRAAFHADWYTGSEDQAAAVRAWLDAHDFTRSVYIGRTTLPFCSVSAELPIGAEFTYALSAQVLAVLRGDRA